MTASPAAGAVPRAGASPAGPFSLNVVRLAGTADAPNDTAQISYVKDGVTVYVESASNAFSDLSDFPGLTMTAGGVGAVDLTPTATTTNTAARAAPASALVTAEFHTESDLDADRGRGGSGYRSHRPQRHIKPVGYGLQQLLPSVAI